jgi:putative N6-adenine-specific DNA methylase
MVPSGIFDMVAKTQGGFEEILAAEITALGGQDVKVMRRAVFFRGDRETLYRANLGLRTALRILIPFKTAIASNADALYQRALEIDWSKFITPRDTFAIDCTTSGELHHHSLFAALRVKDAIADQFMKKQGVRPSVDLEHPTLRINLHINDADVIFALDSSGESLHRRGYRLESNEAPLNEVTAAGLILMTGWDGQSNFVDPMCGSGTLLIEGTMIAMNMAPGLNREGFGFQKWGDFDANLWKLIVKEAKAKIQQPKGTIVGSDIAQVTVELARRNIQRAGLDKVIQVQCLDFKDSRPPENGNGGLLVTNPPYGERMEIEVIEEFYKALGDTFKQHYKGYTAWVLTGSPEGLKRVGLRPSKKIPVFNAAIECRFAKFELFAGRKPSAEAAGPVVGTE